MKRTVIGAIVIAVALVAVPTVVALARSEQSQPTAVACPYDGEGGIDHRAMHSQMAVTTGQTGLDQMGTGQMGMGMGQMGMDQMGMGMGQMGMGMGQMGMNQMGMNPDDCHMNADADG